MSDAVASPKTLQNQNTERFWNNQALYNMFQQRKTISNGNRNELMNEYFQYTENIVQYSIVYLVVQLPNFSSVAQYNSLF